MEDSEKNRYIEFLLQQKEERERTIADKDVFIKNLQDTLDMLKLMHESDSKKIDEMLSKINDLTAQLKLKNKQTNVYGNPVAFPRKMEYGEVVSESYLLIPANIKMFQSILYKDLAATLTTYVTTTIGEVYKSEPLFLTDIVKEEHHVNKSALI